MAATAEVAGFRPEVEVSVPRSNRSADVLLRHWRPGQDAAVDLVVTHSSDISQQLNGTLPAVDARIQPGISFVEVSRPSVGRPDGGRDPGWVKIRFYPGLGFI